MEKNHKFDGKEDGNYHQKPFDDVTDKLPQIDEASAKLADKTSDGTSSEDSDSDTKNSKDRVSEINDTDERDQSDSTKDWDAEHSRTGRHK